MSKRSPRRRLGIVAVRRNIGAPHKQPVRLRRRILASARGRQSKLRRPCDDRARKASDMRRDTDTAPPGPLAVLLARCCAKRGGRFRRPRHTLKGPADRAWDRVGSMASACACIFRLRPKPRFIFVLGDCDSLVP
jgi:hypothetical protein